MELNELIATLGLQPHPEGGYFCETYRAAESIAAEALPARYVGSRSFGTAIYYLITADSFSSLHRVKSDEIFHFYSGDPVLMLQLLPDGSSRRIVLGTGFARGQRPQVVVPAGTWQGSMLVEGGRYALLGATVAPGFEYADFELGNRDALKTQYPNEADLITVLAPKS